MKRGCIVGMALTAIMTSACVMRSTYDDAVTELEATRADLESTKEQQKLLARQVTMLEETTKEATRDAEAAAAAVQKFTEEAEAERRTGEERIAKLKRTMTLLSAAQSRLRDNLELAKEETPALNLSADMYRTRLGDTDGHRTTSFPSQTTPTNETATPASSIQAQPSVATDPVPQPTLTQPTPPPAPSDPAPATRKPANRQTSEPAGEGLFSAIKGWLVSLWRSVFS